MRSEQQVQKVGSLADTRWDHAHCPQLSEENDVSDDCWAADWEAVWTASRAHLEAVVVVRDGPRPPLADRIAIVLCAERMIDQVVWCCQRRARRAEATLESRKQYAWALRLRDTFASTVEPVRVEVSALSDEEVARLLVVSPDLAPAEPWLRRTRCSLPDPLPFAEAVLTAFEKVLSPQRTWAAMLRDLRFPDLPAGDGGAIGDDLQSLYRAEASPDPVERRTAARSLVTAVGRQRNGLAAVLTTAVQRRALVARLAGHPGSLAAELAASGVAPVVVESALEQSATGFPLMHAWQQHRARRLGVPRVTAADLVAPVSRVPHGTVQVEDAWGLVLDALAPLGPEYRAVLERARRDNWLELAAADAIRTATTESCPGFAPVVRVPWTGAWRDVFALAHELGHAVNRWLSGRAQTHADAAVPSTWTELPALVNELLLAEHLQATAARDVCAFAAYHHAGLFVQNYYSSAALLRFQLDIESRASDGRPLTFSDVCRAYADAFAEVYGEAVAVEPDELGMRWAVNVQTVRGPQIFKYLLGVRGAVAALAQLDPERYLVALAAGSSRPAPEVLGSCGVRLDDPDQAALVDARFGDLVATIAGGRNDNDTEGVS